MKNFIHTTYLSREEIEQILSLAFHFKSGFNSRVLDNKSIALVFFNPSLRTRVSMEVAIHQLGGKAVVLQEGNGLWKFEHRESVIMNEDRTEHLKEAVPVLSRYVDGIGIRAFPTLTNWEEDFQEPILSAFCKYTAVPVINLESCFSHPCQAMADIMTIREKSGHTVKPRVVLTWAYHPKRLPLAVPNSFALAASQAGMDLVISSPPEYCFPDVLLDPIRFLSGQNGGSLHINENLQDACEGADIVYAKHWASPLYYSKPDQDLRIREKYKSWMISQRLMQNTNDGYFMHCLPVRRNVVVEDAVLDSKFSVVIDQAENRLHVQKAILAYLFQ